MRSPDVSWIAIAQWNSLTKEQRRRFAPIDPDFTLELMSPTDDLNELQNKMKEYLNCPKGYRSETEGNPLGHMALN